MSAERDGSGGVPAWLVAPLGGVLGFALAPPLAKAAVIAVGLTVVLVFALAHGNGMTVRAAAALYAGRAVLAAAKAVAIVAVEWPLRGAHRIWVRYDAPLRAELGAARAVDEARTAARAGLAQALRQRQRQPAIEVHRAEVLALPPAPAAPVAQPVPAHDTHAA